MSTSSRSGMSTAWAGRLSRMPPTRVAIIYCTGTRVDGPFKGQPCGLLLARARIDHWEEDMKSQAELVCGRCHQRWALADYLTIR